MAHNLFLSMYTYSVKPKFTANTDRIDNNDFLSTIYADVEDPKFIKGFVQDMIDLLDKKTYKNEQETLGGLVERIDSNPTKRTLDLLIDAGVTGIKQFLIDENGQKRVLSDKEIVGLKFFARYWMPAGSNTCFVFIQKYGTLSIKPLFDSITRTLYKNRNLSLIGGALYQTTTKKRQTEFLKRSKLRDIIIVSKSSLNSTGAPSSEVAEIRLKRIKNIRSKTDHFSDDTKAILSKHGIKLGKRNYEIKATYENPGETYNENRTVILDGSEETINIIPAILIPNDCIDVDNYPAFEKMQAFVDEEIKQIIVESKLK